MRRRRVALVAAFLAAGLLAAGLLAALSEGARRGTARRIVPSDVLLPSGYRLIPAVAGLTSPTGIAFGPDGALYVAESGFMGVGEARVLRIGPDGRRTVVARGFKPPITGLAFYRDRLYVSHRTTISAVGPDGAAADLVTGLPSLGDYQNNELAVGPDGWLYFGQGTATNAGVVGTDAYHMGWLQAHQDVRDIPCADVVLRGVNFTSPNPLAGGRPVETGAFVPFGTVTRPGQVITGRVPCNGAVMRADPDRGTSCGPGPSTREAPSGTGRSGFTSSAMLRASSRAPASG